MDILSTQLYIFAIKIFNTKSCKNIWKQNFQKKVENQEICVCECVCVTVGFDLSLLWSIVIGIIFKKRIISIISYSENFVNNAFWKISGDQQ